MGAVGPHAYLLFLALVLCAHGAVGANVKFNATMAAACTAPLGCHWNNHSIWENNTVPGPEDIAIIEGIALPNNSHVMVVISQEDVKVDGIVVNTKAELVVVDRLVEVRALGLWQSYLAVGGGAELEVYSDATFYSSSVGLYNTAVFSVAMYNEVNGSNFVLDVGSVFTIYDNASVWLQSSSTLFKGKLSVEASAEFSCQTCVFQETSVTIGPFAVIPYLIVMASEITFLGGLESTNTILYGNATVQVYNLLYIIQQVYFTNAHSSFYVRNAGAGSFIGPTYVSSQSSLLGDGTLYVVSSTLTVNNNPNMTTSEQTFRGTLFLCGLTFIDLTNIAIVNLRSTTGQNNEPPNITMIANNVQLYVDITFPGNIYVLAPGPSQNGLKITKPFRMAGCVTAYCGIVNAVSFACGTPFLLNSTQDCSSSLILNSTLQAPSLVISESSSMQVESNISVNGTIYNDGLININPGSNISVLGDYHQSVNGTCAVSGLVSGGNTGPISVNGSVYLNGTLLYQLAQNKTTRSHIIIMTVTGSIAGELQPVQGNVSTFFDNSNTSLTSSPYTLTYDQHVVYLEIQDGFLPSLLWLFVPIGGGVVIVIVASIFMAVRNRRRSKYIPIESPVEEPRPVEEPPP